MKIVVLGGAGTIGSGGAEAIARSEGVTEIIVADINLEIAQQLAIKIGRQAKPAYADFNKHSSIVELIRGAAVVMNFSGPFLFSAPLVVGAAIEAGVNYVDICDDQESVEPLLALGKAAEDAGVTILCGLGASPGWTNLVCKQAATKLDKVSDIRIDWLASMLERPGYGVMSHRLRVFSPVVPIFSDGKPTTARGGSGAKVVDWPEPAGSLEVFVASHPETVTLPLYIKGVENITVWGAFSPEAFNELLINMVRCGFTDMTPMKVGETSMSPFDFARYFLTSNRFRQTDKWKEILQKHKALGDLVGFRVDIEGEKNGNLVRYAYRLFNKDRNRQIYMPAVIGAHKIATGSIKQPGVTFPEGLDTNSVDTLLDELNRSGVPWTVEEEILDR